MSASELWWSVRWHIARVAWGNMTFLAAAILDGASAYRREFARTWSSRWRASDRAEFRRYWEASR